MGNTSSNQELEDQSVTYDMAPNQYTQPPLQPSGIYANLLNSPYYNQVNTSSTITDDNGSIYRVYPNNQGNLDTIESSSSTIDLTPEFYQANSGGSSGYIYYETKQNQYISTPLVGESPTNLVQLNTYIPVAGSNAFQIAYSTTGLGQTYSMVRYENASGAWGNWQVWAGIGATGPSRIARNSGNSGNNGTTRYTRNNGSCWKSRYSGNTRNTRNSRANRHFKDYRDQLELLL